MLIYDLTRSVSETTKLWLLITETWGKNELETPTKPTKVLYLSTILRYLYFTQVFPFYSTPPHVR